MIDNYDKYRDDIGMTFYEILKREISSFIIHIFNKINIICYVTLFIVFINLSLDEKLTRVNLYMYFATIFIIMSFYLIYYIIKCFLIYIVNKKRS